MVLKSFALLLGCTVDPLASESVSKLHNIIDPKNIICVDSSQTVLV